MEAFEPSQGLSSIGLIVCAAYLTATPEISPVLERPAPSWAIILSVCAAAFLLSERVQLLCARFSRQDQPYVAIPLEDLHSREAHGLTPTAESRTKSQHPWLRLAFLAVVLVLRIDVFQRTRATGLEAVVPVFVAVANCWQKIFHQHNHVHDNNGRRQPPSARILIKHAFSFVIPATVLSSFGAWAISYTPSALPSTYISHQDQHHLDALATPMLIAFGVALDGFLAFYLSKSLDPLGRVYSRDKSGTIFQLGASCLVAAIFYLVSGVASYIWQSLHHSNQLSHGPGDLFPRILKVAFVFGFMVLFALHSAYRNGLLDTSLLVLCIISWVSIALKRWNQETHFLDAPEAKVLIPLGLLAGIILHSIVNLAGIGLDIQRKPDFPRRRWSLFWFFGLLFACQALLEYQANSEINYHQVDLLMHAANQNYDTWRKAASSSSSLAEATANYIARYNRSPPPHFDRWFEYAENQSSYIIDEFDAIYEDLLPFWSLSPAEIRRRTQETLHAATRGIGGVQIRNGKAAPIEGTSLSDRWEISVMAEMINKFSEFLPDMDLAFNLNDEPRVSLPHKDLRSSLEAAESGIRSWESHVTPVNSFSTGRADGWLVESDQLNLDRFIILSFQNTWDFSSAHCPSDSLARSGRHQDQEIFCASCVLPHSLDLFVSNWTLTADVCHQPDLAHLHGFYISPAAFDVTSHLMPVFSQSKAGGFNDIRHPSPFVYLETAKYRPTEEFPDPEFELKKHAVFWRGANSDGFSKADTGAWRGMARQRMVNLVTNTPSAQAILLPDWRRNSGGNGLHLRYAFVDPHDLHESIETDVQFSQIYRCEGLDCEEQESLFGIGSRKDFQEHWGYKYLLDVDGAGYSGRFIPFLLSKSLPFKMRLFREWCDSRIFPWLHFVPLDLRGQGLWASLAYFAGFRGNVGGESVQWPPRDNQAKTMAEEGAKWARKVLRKEDMEIYMFRLLLEWGRLTDDRRSEIGFSIG